MSFFCSTLALTKNYKNKQVYDIVNIFFRKQYLSIAIKRQRGIPMAWPAHASDHTCITYGES